MLVICNSLQWYTTHGKKKLSLSVIVELSRRGDERRQWRGRESWATREVVAVWSAVKRKREKGGGSTGRWR
ncbi:hypothetical protein Droror1_Dr00008535, partial [Drosera rotundifolia]